MSFPRQHHADKARTRDDYRAQLTQLLVWSSDKKFAEITIDSLAAQYPKLPRAELARELATAQARRSGHA